MQLRTVFGLGLLVAMSLALGACAQTQLAGFALKQAARTPAPVVQGGAPASPPGGTYKVGDPYFINGVRYTPKEDPNYVATGIASWYGHPFHGQRTANGDVYDMSAMTAAHQTLPMPSWVRVTNLENGRSVILTVNDRGPFVQGRIIDVSNRAAQLLGFAEKGTALTRVEAVPSPSENMIATRGAVANPPAVTVAAAPRAIVAAQPLPPAPGVALAPPLPAGAPARITTTALPPEVTLVGVPPVNRIYIQAGAFSSYENANIVRQELASLGPTVIMQVDVNGRPLFRVRLGPLDSTARAEATLGLVVGRGHTEARIVVD